MSRAKKKAAQDVRMNEFVTRLYWHVVDTIIALAAAERVPRDDVQELVTVLSIAAMRDESVLPMLEVWVEPELAPKMNSRPKAWIRWPWEPGSSVPHGVQLNDWIAESASVIAEAR